MNPQALTVLIDADITIYQAAAVSQDTIDFGDGEPATTVLNMRKAKEITLKNIQAARKIVRAKDAVLCLSDRSTSKATFRYRVAPDYKGNRPNIKPELHDELLEHVKSEFKTLTYPGLEGDDVMGVLASGEGRPRLVVYSLDKDMSTVPCRLYVPKTGMKKPRLINQEEADRNWMLQTLTGDATDNYKGAIGIGEKKALQALAGATGLEEMWERVLDVMALADMKGKRASHGVMTSMNYAIQQARLARILRHEDYDVDKGRVRLWHPTTPEWIDAV